MKCYGKEKILLVCMIIVLSLTDVLASTLCMWESTLPFHTHPLLPQMATVFPPPPTKYPVWNDVTHVISLPGSPVFLVRCWKAGSSLDTRLIHVPRSHYNIKLCWHDYLQHGLLPVCSVNVTIPCYYNRAQITSRCRVSMLSPLEKSCLRSRLLFYRYGAGVSEPLCPVFIPGNTTHPSKRKR